jgi:hypothetical protein
MLWMRYLHRSVLLVSLSRLVSPLCATCACLLHPAGELCSAESRDISSQTAVSCIRALRTRCNVASPRPDCHAISVKRGMPRAAPALAGTSRRLTSDTGSVRYQQRTRCRSKIHKMRSAPRVPLSTQSAGRNGCTQRLQRSSLAIFVSRRGALSADARGGRPAGCGRRGADRAGQLWSRAESTRSRDGQGAPRHRAVCPARRS